MIVDFLSESAVVDGHRQPTFGSIACFVVINSHLSSLSCVKRGRRFLGVNLALEHETNAIGRLIASGD